MEAPGDLELPAHVYSEAPDEAPTPQAHLPVPSAAAAGQEGKATRVKSAASWAGALLSSHLTSGSPVSGRGTCFAELSLERPKVLNRLPALDGTLLRGPGWNQQGGCLLPASLLLPALRSPLTCCALRLSHFSDPPFLFPSSALPCLPGVH